MRNEQLELTFGAITKFSKVLLLVIRYHAAKFVFISSTDCTYFFIEFLGFLDLIREGVLPLAKLEFFFRLNPLVYSCSSLDDECRPFALFLEEEFL